MVISMLVHVKIELGNNQNISSNSPGVTAFIRMINRLRFLTLVKRSSGSTIQCDSSLGTVDIYCK